MDYNSFDVVAVPFPFTDQDVAMRRPALILSSLATFNRPAGHSVMAMITSAGNPPWPLDVAVKDLAAAGLPAPSLVRMKLFTLDNRFVERNLGHLSRRDRKKVERSLRALLP